MKYRFKEEIAPVVSCLLLMLLAYLLMLAAVTIYYGEKPSTSPSEAPESVSKPILDILEGDVEEVVMEALTEQEEVVSEIMTMTSSVVSSGHVYFDVPLDHELQDYIFLVCDEYGVDPAIIVAMIEKESTFRANCVGDSGRSLGLMQIQPRWHSERMRDLGVSNLLDPYQNVAVGIDILCELMGRGNGIEWALMAYNGGASYADHLASEGRVSGYAEWVLNRAWIFTYGEAA